MSMKDFEKILDQIHEGWLETQQGTLFGSENPPFELLEDACVEFLKYKGYKIVKPLSRFDVKRLDDLIYLFYAYSDLKHPELINNYRNLSRDRALAKYFVTAREEASNMCRKAAMDECAEIIATIFEHEVEFNFKIPLTFSVLGQKNCGWITEKAIQIMNKKRMNKDEERREALIASLDKKYDAEPGGFEDLDEILKNLKGD